MKSERRRLAEQVGRKVRSLRLKNGLLQGDLSRKIKMNQANVARMESGRHLARLDMLVRVSEALNVTLSSLLSGVT